MTRRCGPVPNRIFENRKTGRTLARVAALRFCGPALRVGDWGSSRMSGSLLSFAEGKGRVFFRCFEGDEHAAGGEAAAICNGYLSLCRFGDVVHAAGSWRFGDAIVGEEDSERSEQPDTPAAFLITLRGPHLRTRRTDGDASAPCPVWAIRWTLGCY